MQRFTLILLFIGFIFNLNAKVIIQEATYTMGDDDSKAIARNKAILKAKRDSIEQAGVYTSSYSEFNNKKLNDTIQSFSGTILKATVLKENFIYPNYTVKIQSDINIELLNQKIKQFAQNGINVENQISSVQNSIEEYNKKANQLIKQRNKSNELKNLLVKKKRLIKKVNYLANNKAINLNIIKNRDYGYISVSSNVKDAEIYIDGKYIGYAPIERFKVPSEKNIELKVVSDKRYYPDDFIKTINIKKLTTPEFKMDLKKGKTEIFLVGENATLYINDNFIKKLNSDNRAIKIDSDFAVKISLVTDSKGFITTKDLYANNSYEINYNLIDEGKNDKIDDLISSYSTDTIIDNIDKATGSVLGYILNHLVPGIGFLILAVILFYVGHPIAYFFAVGAIVNGIRLIFMYQSAYLI